MTDLQERIIRAIANSGTVVYLEEHKAIADAVIEALGIYEDEMGTGATRRTRIVSDWEKP